MNLFSTSRIRNYWDKLPISLRIIITVRLWTSIGASGILYLSPLIFNNLGFTAEEIGSGITAAAFAGIITRFGTGYLLDKKYNYKNTIKIACLISIISDFILFNSQHYLIFISGQIVLGAAAGIYWPSIELAIPLNCDNSTNTSEGYALARSSDAIGLTLGVSIATIGSYLEFTRIVYLIDIISMIYIIYILKNQLYINNDCIDNSINQQNNYIVLKSKEGNMNWLKKLFPLFLITLFITGVMTLLQSLLPLDLANGGIIRPPLIESHVATLLTIQLILIAIFQWPIGNIIKDKKSSFKFRCCLILLFIGFIILSISNFLLNGYLLILIAFIPISIAICIFLPSASNAIIKSSPIKYRGSTMALYSQCFGISALTMPWMSGKLIDNNDTAIQLWLIVSLICLLLIPICKNIK